MSEDPTDASRVSFLFFPFLLNVLVYAHVNVGVFTRTIFFLSRLVDDSADGAPADAWLHFPGLKVGNNYLYSSFFAHLTVLIRDIRSAIFPELGG